MVAPDLPSKAQPVIPLTRGWTGSLGRYHPPHAHFWPLSRLVIPQVGTILKMSKPLSLCGPAFPLCLFSLEIAIVASFHILWVCSGTREDQGTGDLLLTGEDKEGTNQSAPSSPRPPRPFLTAAQPSSCVGSTQPSDSTVAFRSVFTIPKGGRREQCVCITCIT